MSVEPTVTFRVETPLNDGSICCGILICLMCLAIPTFSTAGAQQPATPPSTGTVSRSVWDGVYTEAQAKRGKELYSAHCVTCHGESLEGGGPVHALTGPEFTANWNGLSMGDMLERTRISMPMDKPGTLSRQQVADLLAFVLSVNKFPAGQAELPRQVEVLSQITFLATKPSGDLHPAMRQP